MIKTLSSSSPFLTIEGGTPISTYISGHPNGVGVGNMRFNNSTQNIEVYDGNMWVTLNTSYANIDLSYTAKDLLNWFMKFKIEYEEEKRLRDEHPAIKNAWEQYQVIKTLAEKERENV